MDIEEQERLDLKNLQLSNALAFKQLLDRALAPYTNTLDKFNELKASIQGPVTRLNGFALKSDAFQAVKLAKIDPEVEKIFDCMLSSPEVFRGFDDLPVKTVVDTLVGVQPQDYRKVLKKNFQRKAKKKRKRSRKKDLSVSELVFVCTIIQTIYTILQIAIALGLPAESLNLADLFQVSQKQVQEEICHNNKAEAVDKDLGNGREVRTENSQPKTDHNRNEPNGSHEPTSTLI